LRTYVIPEPQRIVETLRSVDEVKEEEMARRRHWVPGRFHQFLGLHRIFALRRAPATHEVFVASDEYLVFLA
jgi:ABC-type oligopeptide transport system ATPase subunit